MSTYHDPDVTPAWYTDPLPMRPWISVWAELPFENRIGKLLALFRANRNRSFGLERLQLRTGLTPDVLAPMLDELVDRGAIRKNTMDRYVAV